MPGIDEKRDFIPLSIAVLTVSDTRSIEQDKSGATLAERIGKAGHAVAARAVVTDDVEKIRAQVQAWIADPVIDVIISTGGTGFAPRDVTPEATAEVVERPTPGLDEAMREVSRRASPHGLLSRGRSGIVGRTLIVNFPGSPRACAECFDAVAPALGHGVELLLGEPTEHPA